MAYKKNGKKSMAVSGKKSKKGGNMSKFGMESKIWGCEDPMPKDDGSMVTGPNQIIEQMKSDMSKKTNRGKKNPPRF